VPLTGDFRKLETLRRKVAALKDKSLQRVISQNLAQEVLELIAEGFAQQRDPYGAGWRPKKRSDGRSILVRQGRLRRSFTLTRVNSTGFRIGSSVSYGSYHQTGTRRMVARKMVPDDGRLPPSWERAIRKTITEILEDHFRL